MKITVNKGFIRQRNKRGELYNPNGRSKTRLLKDIECELYEYTMIKKGKWKDDDNWQIDGIHPTLGPIDVKCITKYYNISRKKFLYLLQQEEYIKGYYFIEWKQRPKEILKTGDKVEFKEIGFVPFKRLIKSIRCSFKTDGYYADVRRLLGSTV